MNPTIRCLTIAGSDSGGGAGIQADLKTFAALGVYGMSAVTAVTAQNTVEIRAIEVLPASSVRQQMEAVFDDIGADSVKTGMLVSPEIVRTVGETLKRYSVHRLVVDPVITAKTGDPLLHQESLAAMKEFLFPLATLITPNWPEADIFGLHRTKEYSAVLVKGGHSDNPNLCTDVLRLKDGGVLQFESPRLPTQNTHGTGCTLSAAIAAYLGRGEDLKTAVFRGKSYVSEAIRQSDCLKIGQGRGPLNWPRPTLTQYETDGAKLRL